MINYLYKLFYIPLALTIVLVGCTSATINRDDWKKDQAAKKINLEFWATPVMAREDFEVIVKKYTNSVVPHVEINLNYVPFTGVDEKVNVAIAADTFPDIYMDGSVRLGPLSVRGIAAPLDSYITSDYNMDDIVKGPLQISKFNGKTTMFLAAVNPFQGTLLVNKSLFVKAGAEELLPDPDSRTWSRETFRNAVERIGGLGNGIYGMGLAAGAYDHDKFVDNYIYNDGDGLTNETYDKITYNSDRNISNFDWLINLVNSQYAFPGTAGIRDRNLFELFKQGKVGIMNNNVGYYEVIQQGLKDGTIKSPMDVMFAHYPTDDGSAGKLWLSVYGVIIKKQSDTEKIGEAAKYAMWMTSGKDDDVNQGLYVKKGQTPVRKSLQYLVNDREIKKLSDMMENPIGNIFIIPSYQQIRKVWFSQFQQALANQQSAKRALDNFAQEAQNLLDQANSKN